MLRSQILMYKFAKEEKEINTLEKLFMYRQIYSAIKTLYIHLNCVSFICKLIMMGQVSHE